jgi:hypothetical protein
MAVTVTPTAPVASTAAGVAFGVIPWNYVWLGELTPTPPPPIDACPGPFTQCDSDWMWTWYVPAVNGQSIVGNGSADSNIWSKARRRLGNDRALLLVVESVGDNSWAFHAHGRALIKE